MLKQSQLNYIREEAFKSHLNTLLEKEAALGAIGSFAARALGFIAPKITKVKGAVQKAGTLISRYGDKHGVRNLQRVNKKNLPGEVKEMVRNAKPMLGKNPKGRGVQVSLQNPNSNTVQRTLGTVIQDTRTALKNPIKYLKEDFARGGRYNVGTRVVDGKKYNVTAERSRVGKVLNKTTGTTLGWGGLSYAIGGKDDKGKKVDTANRVGSALKDTLLWQGPAAGITAPAMMGKVVYDGIKNARKSKQQKIIKGDNLNGLR
jgi:hypothetical protein